jgi:hypothetical protein
LPLFLWFYLNCYLILFYFQILDGLYSPHSQEEYWTSAHWTASADECVASAGTAAHSPQEDESFEIIVTVPVGEDSQEAQPMPQNHDHDQQEEETNEKEEEEGNKAEGEDDEDYTP